MYRYPDDRPYTSHHLPPSHCLSDRPKSTFTTYDDLPRRCIVDHHGCPAVYERPSPCSTAHSAHPEAPSVRLIREDFCSSKPYAGDVRCPEASHRGGGGGCGVGKCGCDVIYPAEISPECRSVDGTCKCSMVTNKHHPHDDVLTACAPDSRHYAYKTSYDRPSNCLPLRDPGGSRQLEMLSDGSFGQPSGGVACQRRYPVSRCTTPYESSMERGVVLDVPGSSTSLHPSYIRTTIRDESPLRVQQYRSAGHILGDDYGPKYPPSEVVYLDSRERDELRERRPTLGVSRSYAEYDLYRPAPYHVPRHPPATVREVETRYVLGDVKTPEEFKDKYLYPRKKLAERTIQRTAGQLIRRTKAKVEQKSEEEQALVRDPEALSKPEIEFLRNLCNNASGNSIRAQMKAGNLPALLASQSASSTTTTFNSTDQQRHVEPEYQDEDTTHGIRSRMSVHPQSPVSHVNVHHHSVGVPASQGQSSTHMPQSPGVTHMPQSPGVVQMPQSPGVVHMPQSPGVAHMPQSPGVDTRQGSSARQDRSNFHAGNVSQFINDVTILREGGGVDMNTGVEMNPTPTCNLAHRGVSVRTGSTADVQEGQTINRQHQTTASNISTSGSNNTHHLERQGDNKMDVLIGSSPIQQKQPPPSAEHSMVRTPSVDVTLSDIARIKGSTFSSSKNASFPEAVGADNSPTSSLGTVPFSPGDDLTSSLPSLAWDQQGSTGGTGNDAFFDGLNSIDDLFGVITT